jgi:Transposase C of IS166 homeodomain
VSTPLPLPTDLADAHALILRQREELAAAEARVSGAEAMIAHMKLVIAKLRREQYGQSSERGRKLLDQLELQLEELEARTPSRLRRRPPTLMSKASPAGDRCEHLAGTPPRASGSLFRPPAPARSAAAGWRSSART